MNSVDVCKNPGPSLVTIPQNPKMSSIASFCFFFFLGTGSFALTSSMGRFFGCFVEEATTPDCLVVGAATPSCLGGGTADFACFFEGTVAIGMAGGTGGGALMISVWTGILSELQGKRNEEGLTCRRGHRGDVGHGDRVFVIVCVRRCFEFRSGWPIGLRSVEGRRIVHGIRD